MFVRKIKVAKTDILKLIDLENEPFCENSVVSSSIFFKLFRVRNVFLKVFCTLDCSILLLLNSACLSSRRISFWSYRFSDISICNFESDNHPNFRAPTSLQTDCILSLLRHLLQKTTLKSVILSILGGSMSRSKRHFN